MGERDVLAQYQTLTREFNALISPIPFSKDINLRLERITHLLDLLGNPQSSFPAIHVGGTSGKGSTATMIASILTTAGYKTGLYTSPHLQILNERYQIDLQLTPTHKLLEIYQVIKPSIQEVARTNPFGQPSNFEAQVALAFYLFKQEKIDVAIVEVGLGGTLDATNVLNAQIAVLTSVGLDHTEVLGDTIELIAHDKAGIIKPNQIVISGLYQESTKKIVADRCKIKGATRWQLGETFTVGVNEMEETFSVKFSDRVYEELRTSLLGDFQITNAACAIAAVHAYNRDVPGKTIREGLRNAKIPGRMEIVQKNPTVILDGAHNPDKITAAQQAVTKYFPNQERIVVFALKNEKAYKDIIPQVVIKTRILIITTFTTDIWLPFDPQPLAEQAHRQNPTLEIHIQPDPLQAVQLALSLARRQDLVWITGSLYLVGNVRNYWFPLETLLTQIG